MPIDEDSNNVYTTKKEVDHMFTTTLGVGICKGVHLAGGECYKHGYPV